ncbi:MAG: 30S ribosomal protein S20 [Gemmatimonadota bacterium]
MPNHESARKRLRQSEKKRLSNRSVRSEIRTRTRNLFAMDSCSEAEAALRELYAILDRAARRRIVHPNAAARHKARVARYVRSLQEA